MDRLDFHGNKIQKNNLCQPYTENMHSEVNCLPSPRGANSFEIACYTFDSLIIIIYKITQSIKLKLSVTMQMWHLGEGEGVANLGVVLGGTNDSKVICPQYFNPWSGIS